MHWFELMSLDQDFKTALLVPDWLVRLFYDVVKVSQSGGGSPLCYVGTSSFGTTFILIVWLEDVIGCVLWPFVSLSFSLACHLCLHTCIFSLSFWWEFLYLFFASRSTETVNSTGPGPFVCTPMTPKTKSLLRYRLHHNWFKTTIF